MYMTCALVCVCSVYINAIRSSPLLEACSGISCKGFTAFIANRKNVAIFCTWSTDLSITPKANTSYWRNPKSKIRRADRVKETNEKKSKTNDPNLTLCRRNLFVRLWFLLHFHFRHIVRSSMEGTIERADQRQQQMKIMSIYHCRICHCLNRQLAVASIIFPLAMHDDDFDFWLCLRFHTK